MAADPRASAAAALTPPSGSRRRLLVLGAATATGLAACHRSASWRVGLLAPLTSRAADLGQGGRNGAILAQEDRNRAGGIRGRRIELIMQDDAQQIGQAQEGLQRLIAAGVVAVIGPYTSSMAAAVVPLAQKAGLLMLAPTVTASDLFEQQDSLLLLSRSARESAADFARELVRRGQRRVAVAYDLSNRRFTESWLAGFRETLAHEGGQISQATAYESRAETSFSDVIGSLVGSEPQGLLFLAGAIDVARLAQRAQRIAPHLPLATPEWASTEMLLELGGEAVEGLLSMKNYNPEDRTPRYQVFTDTYRQRFERAPDYAAVASHDACTVLFDALQRLSGFESLRTTLLQQGPWQGLQEPIRFDARGNTHRRAWFVEVRRRQFVVLP
ncbi:MAG: ABC transporter substrate-binding protein [Curvibacter sp.]|nr:ABC transporter substrate-binding protein [Curvibacter sp.]